MWYSYPLPPNCDNTEILRVVVRESLSGDLTSRLLGDIVRVTEMLLDNAGPSYDMSTANTPMAKLAIDATSEKGKDLDTDQISVRPCFVLTG